MIGDFLTIVVPVKDEKRNLPGRLENVKAFEDVLIVNLDSDIWM